VGFYPSISETNDYAEAVVIDTHTTCVDSQSKPTWAPIGAHLGSVGADSSSSVGVDTSTSLIPSRARSAFRANSSNRIPKEIPNQNSIEEIIATSRRDPILRIIRVYQFGGIDDSSDTNMAISPKFYLVLDRYLICISVARFHNLTHPRSFISNLSITD